MQCLMQCRYGGGGGLCRNGSVRSAPRKAKGRKHFCFRPFLYSLVGRE